jgi:hypothetical protein
VASDFEHLEILGARHAARARILARSLHESSGPAHPDFGTADSPGDLAAGADADLATSLEARDVDVDFALMRHVVDRMRAAFFNERS